MIYLDFETRSAADLKRVGAYRYSLHETTQVMCAAYAFDDGPVWPLAPWRNIPDLPTPHQKQGALFPVTAPAFRFPAVLRPEMMRGGMDRAFRCPPALREAVEDGEPLAAHYAFFERSIWENYLSRIWGWPLPRPEQWVCTLAAARYSGLPGSLKSAAEALKLDTLKGDNKVMLRLSSPSPSFATDGMPWKGTTEDYKNLIEYNLRDVEVEREVYHECKKLDPRERRVWLLDQRINFAGIPIDVELAEHARKRVDVLTSSANVLLTQIVGGTEVRTTNQVAKLRAWMLSKGVDIPDLKGETVTAFLKKPFIPPEVRTVLQLRQASGSAVSKYSAFLDQEVCGSLYGGLNYYGAHTGRWTAGGFDAVGGAQVQNIVKGTIKARDAEPLISGYIAGEPLPEGVNEMALLESLIRSMICARPGHMFFSFDYSSIEARGVMWLAGEEGALNLFRSGTDVYKDMAGRILTKPIPAVTDVDRHLGKCTFLGLGFGMQFDRFRLRCASEGLVVGDATLKCAIDTYHHTYPKVRKLWKDLESAVKRCITAGKAERVGRLSVQRETLGRLSAISITLPSGRSLYYPDMSVVSGDLVYYGRVQGKTYGSVRTWGGSLTENVAQAIARDVLVSGMLYLDTLPRCRIVMTVHDDILAESHISTVLDNYDKAAKYLQAGPAWAHGFPLAVEGWINKRYKK